MERIQRSKWFFLAGLTILVALYAFDLLLLGHAGRFPSRATFGLWTLGSRLFLVGWISADAQLRPLVRPYEFEAFLFWAGDLAVLYYLCKTRKWRGFLIAMGIWILLAVPEMVEIGVRAANQA
jgi:hypothetical protein